MAAVGRVADDDGDGHVALGGVGLFGFVCERGGGLGEVLAGVPCFFQRVGEIDPDTVFFPELLPGGEARLA